MRSKIDSIKAISEPNRVRILMMLLKKPLCVCEITSVLKLNTSTVSNHLSYLRNQGFILDEKEGKWINYRINDSTDDQIVRETLALLPSWFSDEKVIKEDLKMIGVVDRYQITMNISKETELI